MFTFFLQGYSQKIDKPGASSKGVLLKIHLVFEARIGELKILSEGLKTKTIKVLAYFFFFKKKENNRVHKKEKSN